MFLFTLRLQVRPREAASGTCCQRMQSKFILLLPTKYLPKMNILRSFLDPPPHHRFWKKYNCTLMPILIYPVSKIREYEKSQLHVNFFHCPSISDAYVSTPSLCVFHSALSWKAFQKLCQSNPDPLAIQDLKKGDLLGKGADAVVSIFLLPGNHKVGYHQDCPHNKTEFRSWKPKLWRGRLTRSSTRASSLG